ncbi:MAG TPA: archease [Gallionella sp.]|nr:archease [Gallionella sp.]
MGRWEHFAHESDIGVRGIGASCAEAFEQAAVALTAIVTDPVGVMQTSKIELSCESPDMELLLADWLNAVIYEMATRHMLFSRYQVRLEGGHLDASAWGEAVELSRHRPAVEPKGATYTALTVSQQKDGNWLAQCVVDV